MTDREKLIEILQYGMDKYFLLKFEAEIFADLLITNGVTFATDTNVGGKWISVEDRLPPANTPVMVFRPKMALPILVDEYERYLDEDEEWQEGWARYGRNLHGEGVVTHWMPLPKPPKEE